MRRLAAALLLALVAIPAYAGIIIQRNGNVFVGTIEPEDVTEKTIKIHRVSLVENGPEASGEMLFDRRDVRWFDREARIPTDAYFEKFLEEPLALPWEHYREEYRLRVHEEPPTVPRIEPTLVLAPIAVVRSAASCELSIRNPLGWSATDVDGILMLASSDGKARIHVFAGELAGERALSVARATLARLGARIDAEKAVAGALEWDTTVHRASRDVHALRRVVQNDRCTAFAIAYASEGDWERSSSLLRRALDTFSVREP